MLACVQMACPDEPCRRSSGVLGLWERFILPKRMNGKRSCAVCADDLACTDTLVKMAEGNGRFVACCGWREREDRGRRSEPSISMALASGPSPRIYGSQRQRWRLQSSTGLVLRIAETAGHVCIRTADRTTIMHAITASGAGLRVRCPHAHVEPSLRNRSRSRHAHDRVGGSNAALNPGSCSG